VDHAVDLAEATEAVTRATAAALAGRAGTRALVFLGDVDPYLACRGTTGPLLTVDCSVAGPDSLVALRPLVDVLLPQLREHAPDLLQRFAPELAALHPNRADGLELPKERWLSHLANTPSERRSHRESEMLFRIVNGLSQLLHEASDRIPAWQRAPVVTVWRDLHAADAATLLAFRRLARWAHQGRSRFVLVANLAPDVGSLSASQPIDDRFDHDGHRGRLLGVVRQQFLGAEFHPAGDWPRASQARWPDADTGPHPVADALALLAAGKVEEGSVRAIRAMAPAAFSLNYPTVLRIAEQVIRTVGAATEFDQAAFDAEWARTEPEEYYAALEFAVIRPADRRALVAAAWRAAGFANSCLDAHEVALRCYEENLALAETPERRAEARMYLGLITGKRLRRIPDAQAHIDAGVAEVDGRTDDASLLEQCWLLNVSALMAFQQRQHSRAMAMVRRARDVMRPIRSSEATHLKVNLISNISVLLEETGRAEKAAELWQYFTAFLSSANELFAKHYYFREGGLQLAAGRLDEAAESYRASLRQAEAIDDPFHAAVVAGACGYVAYRVGDYPAAAHWYRQAADASRAAGDHEELPRALAAHAFAQGRAGDRTGGAAILATAVRANEAVDGLHTAVLATVSEWLATTATDSAAATAACEDAVIRFAGTKLNRPFYLVNTYRTGEG
jgi:tetratricopeptide (TPR) repeat protein